MAHNEQADPNSEITTESGLKYRDLIIGTGREAALGHLATVHYTGWLTNGAKFASSVDRRDPFSFPYYPAYCDGNQKNLDAIAINIELNASNIMVAIMGNQDKWKPIRIIAKAFLHYQRAEHLANIG